MCIFFVVLVFSHAVLQTALHKATKFCIDYMMLGRVVISVTYSTLSSQVLNCCLLRCEIIPDFISEWEAIGLPFIAEKL